MENKRKKIDMPDTKALEAELKRIRYRKNYRKIIWNTISSLLVVAAIAVLISMLFLPVLRVTGTSMAPTLQNDELCICHKQGKFKQGDVIAFYYNNKILLKRVIGTSGDIIDIDESGTVYVNGIELDESYLSEKSYGECDIELPYQVPESRVFVMGDNRTTSIDSRSTVVGCVAEESVVGKIVLRVWPIKEFEFFN